MTTDQKYQVKAADYKKEVVKKIADLIEKNKIIGVVNLENLPAPQLQNMRSNLRGKVVLFMAKKRLINLALDLVKDKKKNIINMKDHLRGMPALIFTDENPFSLFKEIKKNKSNAPAKAGQTAPNDIIVPAGKTPFSPGPVIGELGAIGIKSSVQDGKVVITEDSVVCKDGEKITQEVAGLLTRLSIEPMEVGLDLVATYEDGVIYDKKVLDIDEDKFNSDISNACSWAVNLSVEIGYSTKETIGIMLTKAFSEAKSVVMETNFLTDLLAKDIIMKAEKIASSMKSQLKLN